MASVRLLVGLALLWWCGPGVQAFPRLALEQEPNDTPDTAQELRGEARLIGEVLAEDRDLFRWRLDDDDVDHLWRVELLADHGAGISLEVEPFSAQAPVQTGIATFGSVAESESPEPDQAPLLALSAIPQHPLVVEEGLLIPGGDYLIRLAGQEGGGAYQLVLSREAPLTLDQRLAGDSEPQAVMPGRDWLYHLDVAESSLPLALEEADDDALWAITASGELGTSLELWVTDAEGERVSEPTGAGSQALFGRLPLDPGARLQVRQPEGESAGRVLLRLEEDGRRRPREAEPQPPPAWLEVGETVELMLQPGARERLALRVTEASVPLSLDLISDTGERVSLCWVDDRRDDQACRLGPGSDLFRNLQLPAGDYRIEVVPPHRGEPFSARLSLSEGSVPPDGRVDRPNESPGWAYPMAPGEQRQGHLADDGEAWFALSVGPEVKQWQLEASAEAGKRLSHLALYRPADLEMDTISFAALRPGENRELAVSGRNAESLRLDHLRLLPGRYLVRLSGSDTDYRLTVSPGEALAPGREMEPNDLPRQANPLWLGEEIRGGFHRLHDIDMFQFRMPGWNRARLHLDPPQGVQADARLLWEGETRYQNEHLSLSARGEAASAAFWLSPGDMTLWLRGQQAATDDYRIRLELIPPWDLSDGATPADSPEQAPMLPRRTRVGRGLQGESVDAGFLRLPAADAPRELRLLGHVVSPEAVLRGGMTSVALSTAGGETILVETEVPRQDHRARLPAGEEILMEVAFGHGTQVVEVIDEARPEPLPLVISIEDEDSALAAFIAEGQTATLSLLLENPLKVDQELSLEAHLSHSGARLEGLPEALHLEGGEARVLALSLSVPPELPEGDTLSLFVRAGDHDTRHDIAVKRDVAALSPEPWLSQVERYHGLVDLAWAGLGAAFVDPDSGDDVGDSWRARNRELRALLDGLSSASAAHWREWGDPLPPIRLASEGGEVHALLFNQRSSHDMAVRWRHVEIAMGDTPNRLSPLMEVELDARDGEQIFPLEAPRQARYVQLTPRTTWGGEPPRGTITGSGMFRALGNPAGSLAERRHDLLDPAHGGHWLYTLPDLRLLHGLVGQRHTMGNQGRQAKSQVHRGEPIRGRTIEMVFGFLNQRSARIGELRWIDDLDWQGNPVENVRVYTSTEGPVGPWKPQASWELERDADGVARLELPDAPWARYLQLVFDEPAADPEQHSPRWRIPARVQAIEASDLASKESILAYWGLDHTRGPYEVHVEGGLAEAPAGRVTPPAGERLGEGRFEEPGESEAYRIHLEEGNNTLALFLEETLRGRLSATLSDPEGEEVSLEWHAQPGGRAAEAVGLAPGEYRLTLAEPPRSIVFIWDGSGSVGRHQPAIHQALVRFAEGLRPGREVVNLMAMGGPLLIDGWGESPAAMAMALGHYDMRYFDSDAEPSLRLASHALEQRDGEKVIFLITDAEQVGRDLGAWEALARVKPRIFTMSLGHGGDRDPDELRWYQDLMHAWARVGDGHYAYAAGRNDLIAAFEASMRKLRRPTDYALAVDQRWQAPPEPGTLRVVSGEAPVVGAGVVQLIFDASGSMLRAMEGGRRIEVARRIVSQVLDERVPSDVPVALRAFGHTEPHSCATELLVAPTPGNHDKVRQTVDDIRAINLARTPLAVSLTAAQEDLAEFADQPRLVVMLTDGEETCEGDLDAAVEALAEEGIDVRLNIVGFHIDDPVLQGEFARLARLGGGDYFDSRNDRELVEGLSSALAAEWRVLDDGGHSIAMGRVDGDPVALPVGEHELVVQVQGENRRQMIKVSPGEDVEFSLE